MKLKGRNFLTLLDYTTEEIAYLLDLSVKFKEKKKAGIPHRLCEGKNIALIFEKTSTRTRCSFEVAARDLGMGTTYLDPAASQIGKKESTADTARVLSGIFDGIEYRGYSQRTVEELAKHSSVPVWNGLTDEFHPTQILADLLTIEEVFGKLKGVKFTYFGDARFNMGRSLLIGCSKMGLDFTVASAEKYYPDKELIAKCADFAKQSGSSIAFESDPYKAAQNADVIYTDIWVSMGEPVDIWKERIDELSAYAVTKDIMAVASSNAVFMHCLPSYHDKKTEIGKEMCEKFGRDSMEVTNEVFESNSSVVFREAENRMHTIKALMAATLGGELI